MGREDGGVHTLRKGLPRLVVFIMWDELPASGSWKEDIVEERERREKGGGVALQKSRGKRKGGGEDRARSRRRGVGKCRLGCQSNPFPQGQPPCLMPARRLIGLPLDHRATRPDRYPSLPRASSFLPPMNPNLTVCCRPIIHTRLIPGFRTPQAFRPSWIKLGHRQHGSNCPPRIHHLHPSPRNTPRS